MKSLLVLTLVLLASCASAPQERENPLAGEWLYKDPIQSCRYLFRADGSFSGEVTHRGETLSRFTGVWRVDGNWLLYEYKTDVLGSIEPGTKDRDRLLGQSRDHFVIQASDGSRRTYRRVR